MVLTLTSNISGGHIREQKVLHSRRAVVSNWSVYTGLPIYYSLYQVTNEHKGIFGVVTLMHDRPQQFIYAAQKDGKRCLTEM